jgi:undecaprenyl-diphosphatase
MNRRPLRRAALRGALSAVGGAAAGAASRRGRRAVVGGALSGFVAGAAVEQPVAAVLGPAVLLVRPGAVPLAGGVLAAAATTRAWPVAPNTPARSRPALTPVDGEARPDGGGITFVVNSQAGSVARLGLDELLAEELPAATVLDVEEGGDLDAALATAAEDTAIGIAGGDGTINAAAAVALRHDKPLVVVPAGTLNHLARDLGLDSPEDTVAAVRNGQLVAVDLGSIDGKPFLNTASFGSYSELVDARERLEDRVGKWPALMAALWRVLRRTQPVRVEIDGRPRRLWMVFIGNCGYHPHGFAPTWRERLDDGLLDVRLVDADHPWARTRLLLAVLTGRLGRSVLYEEFRTDRLEIRSLDGPLRLARDGETFDGGIEVSVCKEPRRLAVYVPLPD